MFVSILTIESTAHHIIDPFLPIYLDKIPNTKVPKIAESDGKHPTQAASSNVSGPDGRGEESDLKIGVDGEVHPIVHPFPITLMFAVN